MGQTPANDADRLDKPRDSQRRRRVVQESDRSASRRDARSARPPSRRSHTSPRFIYRDFMIIGGGLLVATGVLGVTGLWITAVQHL
jgi:hypothetical protein